MPAPTSPRLPEAYLLGYFIARIAFGRALQLPASVIGDAKAAARQLLLDLGAPRALHDGLDHLSWGPAPLGTGHLLSGQVTGEKLRSFEKAYADWLAVTFSAKHTTACSLGFVVFSAIIYANAGATNPEFGAALIPAIRDARDLAAELGLDPWLFSELLTTAQTGTPATSSLIALHLSANFRSTLLEVGGAHLQALAAR